MNLEIQALSDPKRKLTAKQRRKFWSLHEKTLAKPWWKARPTRAVPSPDGQETRLEKANRLRDARRKPAGLRNLGAAPTSEGLKVVTKLNALSLARLISFMKRAARRAATAMYAAAKCKPGTKFEASFQAEQTRQLALYRACKRIIEMRLNPNPNPNFVQT